MKKSLDTQGGKSSKPRRESQVCYVTDLQKNTNSSALQSHSYPAIFCSRRCGTARYNHSPQKMENLQRRIKTL